MSCCADLKVDIDECLKTLCRTVDPEQREIPNDPALFIERVTMANTPVPTVFLGHTGEPTCRGFSGPLSHAAATATDTPYPDGIPDTTLVSKDAVHPKGFPVWLDISEPLLRLKLQRLPHRMCLLPLTSARALVLYFDSRIPHSLDDMLYFLASALPYLEYLPAFNGDVNYRELFRTVDVVRAERMMKWKVGEKKVGERLDFVGTYQHMAIVLVDINEEAASDEVLRKEAEKISSNKPSFPICGQWECSGATCQCHSAVTTVQVLGAAHYLARLLDCPFLVGIEREKKESVQRITDTVALEFCQAWTYCLQRSQEIEKPPNDGYCTVC